nr:uncharacterized protein CI109_001590 [Kwoniella shandongensis]KAA5530184.1 hypothetical protein CI109_001590 [Kwoniella shandongensis]
MSPLPYDLDPELYYFPRRAAADVLTPNDTQKVTLIVAACYVVAIAICMVSDSPSHDQSTTTTLPYLEELLYPFKLLTVGMHEMSHAIAGVLTCASVEQITLDPHEGGSTRMRGGIPAITLPAGYLGSSFIGACLIACGFDTDASKVACLVLAFFWILTLWWARRSWIAFATIALMAALVIICWLVAHSVALRFLVLFIGVMSCFYAIWDIVDDTLARKVNTSDASEYANIIGCCGSRFWGEVDELFNCDPTLSSQAFTSPGAFWLIIACCFFVAGILVGIAAFKDDWHTQAEKADNFLGGTP